MKKFIIIATLLLLSLFRMQAQERFTVVIDPGHGGRDPGCTSSAAYEKTINLAVALLLGNLIEQNHADTRVIYTRRNDVFISLDERANIANRNKADLFISIHVNSVKRGNASGAETYTLGLAGSEENLEVAMRENSVILMEDDYLRIYEGFDPNFAESYIIFELMQSKHLEQSVSLASEIQKSFVNADRRNRGVRQAGFLVLRKTSMPSVLIELGFLSNRTEERYMVSKEGQRELSRAIYQAFSSYKKDYDRKKGIMADIPIETIPVTTIPAATTSAARTTAPATRNTDVEKTSPPENQDVIIYKVQILTSDKKLSEKDRRFKGYDNISYYVDKGIYKYTYGSTSDYAKIMSMHRKAAKDFKGAFIIRTKNGKRIN